jgi:uncharacterized protein (TIGR00251 family)
LIDFKTTSEGVTFTIKVHPRARKNAIAGEIGGVLKVAVMAPPVEGRANEACVRLLADVLNVPRASVTIAAGQGSRNKVIRVAGLSAEEVRLRLERRLSE